MINAKEIAAQKIARATEATGLYDWGGDEFIIPLQLLMGDIHNEARLTSQGLAMADARIQTMLVNRLRLTATRKSDPSIVKQTIRQPIFIMGFPRSGSTFAHAILSCDPAHRTPRLWEIIDPVPAAQSHELDGGPRAEKVQQELEMMGFSSPILRSIHHTNAITAEECGFIFELSLATRNYTAFWHLPNYSAYIDQMDYRPVYAQHHRFLQHAQSGCAGTRWVLKAPMHIFHIEELLDIYPDAIIIQNHRDPSRVLPSISSFIGKLRGLFSENQDPQALAREQFLSWRNGLDRMARARENPRVNARVFDMHFSDLVHRPLEVVSEFYARYGLDLTPDATNAMTVFLDNSKNQAQGNTYQLSSYGLSLNEIENLYGDYISRYNVQRETAL